MTFLQLDNIPDFSEEEINKKKANGNTQPLLFEYYKWLGIFIIQIASIEYAQNGMKGIDKRAYGIFIGQCMRIGKLMGSNMVLMTINGHYNNSIAILGRCIMESAFWIKWLCDEFENNSITQFINQSFKEDLKLKKYITDNVAIPKSEKFQEQENKILSQIQKRREEAGSPTDEDIRKRFPNWLEIIGDNPTYRSGYAFSSHILHGDWIGLRWGGAINEQYEPIFDEREVDPVVLLVDMLMVIESLSTYIQFIFDDEEIKKDFLQLLQNVKKKILYIYEI